MSKPYCEWSESMSVGMSILDADHRFLAGHISRLHQDLRDGADPEAIEQLFDGLIAFLDLHFFREAKVMETRGFPDAKAHQEERADFTRYIHEWHNRHQRGAGSPITIALLHYLKSWFNHHVLIWDMAAYKPYGENNALGVEVAETFGPALVDDAAAASSQRPPNPPMVTRRRFPAIGDGSDGVHHEPG